MSRSDCVSWTNAQWTAFWAVRWNDEFEATAARIARPKVTYASVSIPCLGPYKPIGNAWFEGPKHEGYISSTKGFKRMDFKHGKETWWSRVRRLFGR